MKKYGLIGFPLSHSFSKEYFNVKFLDENINDCHYKNYELKSLNEFNLILKEKDLLGLNVTIPYKEEIISYLDEIDEIAKKIGSVNVIKISRGRLIGFNSDYLAFNQTIKEWLPSLKLSALILGSGGSSKAVKYALDNLNISYTIVSRNASANKISYDDLNKGNFFSENKLIINTTPLGMFPKLNSCPDIDFSQLNEENYVYDLIYNPEITDLLSRARKTGAKIKNGLEMLHLQAKISWDLWNN